MVPMIAPDGTPGDIPFERMNDAKAAGFKAAVVMKSQDGQTGYIPADRYVEAAKSGLKIVPLEQQDTQHEGFWNHAVSASEGLVKGLLKAAAPPMPSSEKPEGLWGILPSAEQLKHLQPVEQYKQETQDQRNPAYKAVAAVGPVVGVRVGEMERAANEGDIGGVAGEAAVPAAAAIGTYGASKALPAAADALPSAKRAGAAFQEIRSAAGDIPIETSKVGDSALQLYEQAQRGATFPTAVNKLIKRMTAPDAAPLTYAEAKDFQSNISNLSANEKMSLKPNQVRLVGQLNGALKESLEGAAEVAGKGQQFTQAMKEYHDAMKLRGYSDAVISNAWKLALRGAGVYGAARVFGLVGKD